MTYFGEQCNILTSHMVTKDEYHDVFPLSRGVNTHCKENVKILNLILYSNSSEYNEMYKILSFYLKKIGIEHYFYCFDENIKEKVKIIGNVIYFKGNETFTPGILDKTLLAFDYFKDYDYDFIIRTNISTIINFKHINFYLNPNLFDYGGCFYFVKNHIHPYIFIHGMCLMFSKKAIKYICSHISDINKNLIDDQAFGLLFESQKNTLKRMIISSTVSINCEYPAFVYRNKSKNRIDDIKRMSRIISSILTNNSLTKNYIDICLTSIFYHSNKLHLLFPGYYYDFLKIYHEYSSMCDSVVEINSKNMTLTYVILHALRVNMRYVSINYHDNYTKAIKDFCYQKNINFEVSLKLSNAVDFMIINPKFTYQNTMYILKMYSSMIKKYIIIYGSSLENKNCEYDCFIYPEWINKEKKGIWNAIEDFLNENNSWMLKTRKINNNGLTILERKI